MNTKQLLSAHRKAYKELVKEYRDELIPKLDANKAKKKEMRKEIAFIGLMSKTSSIKPEDKERLSTLAKEHGDEFNEGIPPKPEVPPSPSEPQEPMMIGDEEDSEDFDVDDGEEK